jgi:hypothetical protein
MNNKYKIGDKVLHQGNVVSIVIIENGEFAHITDELGNTKVVEIKCLHPYIEEDNTKAKFNKGDKVRAIGSLAIDGKHNRLGIIEVLMGEESWVLWETDIGQFSCRVPNRQLELIEQNTIEEDTPKDIIKVELQDTDIKISTEPPSKVSLNYEKEYNKLLEEHEQTKELLEIAKVALKLTTELISTNE